MVFMLTLGLALDRKSVFTQNSESCIRNSSNLLLMIGVKRFRFISPPLVSMELFLHADSFGPESVSTIIPTDKKASGAKPEFFGIV